MLLLQNLCSVRFRFKAIVCIPPPLPQCLVIVRGGGAHLPQISSCVVLHKHTSANTTPLMILPSCMYVYTYYRNVTPKICTHERASTNLIFARLSRPHPTLLSVVICSPVNSSCRGPGSTVPAPSDTDREPSSAGGYQSGSETSPGVRT